ncbi:helix-turn-helix domain-containing protein [Jidongwangia harbinensis]|uniref:helix-turn-helix domain-containing protein n=1 Tax=Jidongwangia harbinensis TaxID=2878561 RepID=UPI001CD9DF4F|nr:helix-turn-helix transcriptional regulator [Jidongwangia harbinensis]MCA2217508.1 helix-turn-helix transcriptional regulator [Jidongwangia harbinensis]
MADDIYAALNSVGPRLRAIRKRRGRTLEQLAALTGTSVSMLSRIESGRRRPTLEVLLPLARAYRIPLDELVGSPATGDPRIYPRPVSRDGTVWVPLSRDPGGINAFKLVLRVPARAPERLDLQVHEGREWIYVLTGTLRLALSDQDLRLGPGEAAEFDTWAPHAMANVGSQSLELLIIFGQQGQGIHLHMHATS